MTYLRHASRHLHHTVANHVEQHLAALGWTTPGEVPFDATPLKIWKSAAVTSAGLDRQVGSGTVAITLGNELAPEMEEVGGPLASQEYPVFIDVFQDKESITLALANDVRDILLGRLPGTRRSMNLVNQMTGNVEPDWWIEFDDVERVKPDHSFSLHWQVVKVTATAYFMEVRY